MKFGNKDNTFVAGTATRDAEYKTIGDNNTPLASFSLAINKRNTDGKYVDCKAFGQKLAKCAQNIKKGDPVAVAGYVESREYNGKTYHDIICQWIGISAAGSSQQPEPSGYDDYPEYEETNMYDDDLPF